jgi:hypothetical protein
MRGIIPVEEFSEPSAFAALAVIQRKQGNRQPAGHMHHTINMIVDNKESDGIQRNNCHKPEHLLAEISPASSYQQDCQRRSAAPVRSDCQRTPDYRNEHFQADIPNRLFGDCIRTSPDIRKSTE